MSRHLRHTQNPPVGQKSAKKTAPANKNVSSSDDDYAGVDLVSDTSDEDEPDVEKAETTAIMESAEVTDDEQFSLGGLDQDFSPDLFPETQFFNDQLIHMPDPELETGSEQDEPVEISRPRTRVRFVSPSTGSSTSATAPQSSSEGGIYIANDPDIFWDRDSLAPAFRAKLDANTSSESSSCWDLEGELGVSQPDFINDDDGSDGVSVGTSSGGSSGYETESDDGETTDEEIPIGSRVGLQPSVLRAPDTSDSEEEVPTVRSKGPRFGSFIQEPEKPYATMDKSGKRLIMFRARNSSLILGDPDQLFSPMFEKSTMTGAANVMVSAMLNPSTDLFGNQAFPPEAFYAYPSLNPDSSSFDEGEDEDEDGEEALDYDAFVHFGDETSEEEEGKAAAGGEKGLTSTFDTESPSRTAAAGEEQGSLNVLGHLSDGNLIGAFRKNQSQHQLISRNAATRDGLEFVSQSGQGPIRGIKGGRLAAANTPITPLRKQKKVKIMTESSPGSPLANTAAQKRKSSGDLPNNHKRPRVQNK